MPGMANNRADADQAHEQQVEPERVPAQPIGKGAVEAEQLELFVQQQGDAQHHASDDRDEHRVAAHHARGLPEDEAVEACAVASRLILHHAAEHDAHAKEPANGEGDGGVLLHACEGAYARDEGGGEHARDERASKERGEVAIAQQQVCGAHARERGVGDGISDKAAPAQHGKAAHERSGDAQQRGAEQHGAGVGILQRDESQQFVHAC
jgi:hypothetical protein